MSLVKFPKWAEDIRQKYLVGESSVFVLHGNVFDVIVWDGNEYTLNEFLINVLLRENKYTVYQLDPNNLSEYKISPNSSGQKITNSKVHQSYSLLDKVSKIQDALTTTNQVGVIVNYAEMIFPSAEINFLSTEERQLLSSVHSMSMSDYVLKKDNIVIFISESLQGIHPMLISNPYVASIELEHPSYEERLSGISFFGKTLSEKRQQQIAEYTSGLRIIQIKTILASDNSSPLDENKRTEFILELLGQSDNVNERAKELSHITAGLTKKEIAKLLNPSFVQEQTNIDRELFVVITKRKKEIIEHDCFGLIEFVEPTIGLDQVGGNTHIKQELMNIATTIKQGNKKLAPMGLLAVGPMGSGKTFVIKAFLKEAGIPGVILKNFRSKWQGSTESNLARVLSTVKSMGPVAVVIDEGDRSFGKGESGSETDGGTSSRVIAKLKEFMSDTSNRGNVLFIMMTNRPDKLDTDLKRPGRLDKKIPFFYPETVEERFQVLDAVAKRYKFTLAIDWTVFSKDFLEHFSNADLEALVLLAAEMSGNDGTEISQQIFTQACEDFIPPQETSMIAYMELLAVKESSRRSLLPERYRNMSVNDIDTQLKQLSFRI